jgi:hypothetical protein
MSYLDAPDVNSWLEGTKLTLPPASTLDPGIETLVAGVVLGALGAKYDTTSWINKATTPPLVTSLIAMRYAAAIYRRQYSEDLTNVDNHWAKWLEMTAEATAASIVDGPIDIPGVDPGEQGSLGNPLFWPNDASSVDDPAKFSMGMVI